MGFVRFVRSGEGLTTPLLLVLLLGLLLGLLFGLLTDVGLLPNPLLCFCGVKCLRFFVCNTGELAELQHQVSLATQHGAFLSRRALLSLTGGAQSWANFQAMSWYHAIFLQLEFDCLTQPRRFDSRFATASVLKMERLCSQEF